MVLTAEEDGEDAEALGFVVDFEVEDGAVLGDRAQSGTEVWAECALVGLAAEGKRLRSYAERSPACAGRCFDRRVAKPGIAFDKVIEDR